MNRKSTETKGPVCLQQVVETFDKLLITENIREVIKLSRRKVERRKMLNKSHEDNLPKDPDEQGISDAVRANRLYWNRLIRHIESDSTLPTAEEIGEVVTEAGKVLRSRRRAKTIAQFRQKSLSSLQGLFQKTHQALAHIAQSHG